MKKKVERFVKLLIGVIVLLVILGIIFNLILIKKLGGLSENKGQLIKENLEVCYLPKDCFETYEGYLNQFPEKEKPEMFPECLVICF